jgi:hypothetical protein
MLPKDCVYAFCVVLRTNSNYFAIHQRIGFYNWGSVCLLRGTN